VSLLSLLLSPTFRSSLGYEPYDGRLQLSQAVSGHRADLGLRATRVLADASGLPRLKSFCRVSCTNPCKNLVADLPVSGSLACVCVVKSSRSCKQLTC
jgi:hypothetical protein